ncbi:glycoside hydrolase family 3 protein [Desulfovibrio sp. TomC]|uniref:glycoside hydrolase family 3 protein n=1 Tax=Desulfovibrio sp. TomC TaxID=1562888 RepID=UPI000575E09D|nr:glycoside hydrolase family 3 protein [Desulfovibrio sp. TomC]KHK04482.1 Beta-hexosaminidase [Desulfovibrio sp. TomC]
MPRPHCRLVLLVAAVLLSLYADTAEAASRVSKLLAAMSVEEKVGQVFMLWFQGPTVSDDIAGLIRDRHLGGVILYSAPGNIETPEQVAELTAGLQAQAAASGQGVGLLVGVDQEGAPVARLRRGFTLFPSQMAQAATDRSDFVRQAAAATARELRAVGINTDFAPVADVNINPDNPIIGIRSFGSSPSDAARYTAAATAGYANAGVICTPKHFPGHGDTSVDSHVGLPRVDHDARTLDRVDFPPFRAAFAANAPAVMTAHVVAPALAHGEPALPATLSRHVLEGVLRGRMGFDGVIFTDSLGMGAVANTYGTAEASVMALIAGADVLLIGADAGRPAEQRQVAMDAVLAAVRSGRVPAARLNAAVSRVLRLKEHYGLLDAVVLARPAADVAARVGRNEDALLARRIAARSLTAFGPAHSTLPLPAVASTLVIRPRLGREVIDAEAEAALALWPGPQTLFLPPDPDAQTISDVLEKARQSKNVVLLVTDARRQSGQVRLATALSALADPPVVLVAAQSPYDLALVPQTTVCIATYGEAPASLEALGQSLFAPFRFTGRAPAVLPSHP